MHRCKVIASLDVVMQLLDDQVWRKKAINVKTLGEMRQILIDFCKANGNLVQLGENTLGAYMNTETQKLSKL